MDGVKTVRSGGALAFVDCTGEASRESALKHFLGADDYATHYADEEQIVWVNVPAGTVEFFNHSTGAWAEFGGEA